MIQFNSFLQPTIDMASDSEASDAKTDTYSHFEIVEDSWNEKSENAAAIFGELKLGDGFELRGSCVVKKYVKDRFNAGTGSYVLNWRNIDEQGNETRQPYHPDYVKLYSFEIVGAKGITTMYAARYTDTAVFDAMPSCDEKRFSSNIGEIATFIKDIFARRTAERETAYKLVLSRVGTTSTLVNAPTD
jgi:hypothetical protein